MKVLGAEVSLATGSTGLTSTGAAWVFNTGGSAGLVTVRNADDNANIGTIRVPSGGGIVIHLEAGEGLRGANTIKATPIGNSGY
tara:strand:+ start:61 stop:312 length:252 start_codon:yes stop_codon:yes gene_type:complete